MLERRDAIVDRAHGSARQANSSSAAQGPKVCGLSAGGRWIRTSSTRARSIWLSALWGGLCFAIGCGPGEAVLVQRGISAGLGDLSRRPRGGPPPVGPFGALDWARPEVMTVCSAPVPANPSPTGRADMIARHRSPIFAAAVERILTAHPVVHDAVVIGIP